MKSTNLLRVCVLFALAAFAVATADTAEARLFGRLRGGCCQTSCCEAQSTCCEQPACGCEAPVADCGCVSTPAPVVEAAPVVADCGCAAPVADCGCAEAPACCEAEPCCNEGRRFRLFGGLRRGNNCCEPATDCGCGC